MFYKLKALHQAGIKVILHCFHYGERKPQKVLEEYAEKVYYYPRKTGLLAQFSSLPYIVQSRLVSELLANLKQDAYPILAEGLHCAGFFSHPDLISRHKLLRMHNVEWQYYRDLARGESFSWKRLYFSLESRKLKAFENTILPFTDEILTISEKDYSYFKSKHNKSVFIPPFHAHEEITAQTGTCGKFALFHGRLDVSDNIEAAEFLIQVFANLDFPLVLAGKNPVDSLRATSDLYEHISLVTNPGREQMEDLQHQAHIHVLYTSQTAGMKLKLLDALFRARHIIVNQKMLAGTGVGEGVAIAESIKQWQDKIKKLKEIPLSQAEKNRRANLTEAKFSNQLQANRILDLLNQEHKTQS